MTTGTFFDIIAVFIYILLFVFHLKKVHTLTDEIKRLEAKIQSNTDYNVKWNNLFIKAIQNINKYMITDNEIDKLNNKRYNKLVKAINDLSNFKNPSQN